MTIGQKTITLIFLCSISILAGMRYNSVLWAVICIVVSLVFVASVKDA